MKHVLISSPAFMRSLRRLVRKDARLAEDVAESLRRLADNPHDSLLKTHKLKGPLAGSWACTAGYDLRIVFRFARHRGAPAIELEQIGTHDEVY